MKNLKNLLDGNKLKSDIQFKKLCINSNDIDPGDIFVALKNSSKRDGNKYIDHAFDNGAVAAMVSKKPECLNEDDNTRTKKILRLGIRDQFTNDYGSQDSLMESYGLQPNQIAKTIEEYLLI